MNRKAFPRFLFLSIFIFTAMSAQQALAVYPKKEWTYRIKPDVRRGSVSFIGDMAVLESSENTLHFVDLESGESYWKFKFYSPVELYILDDTRIVAFSDNIFHVLDIKEKKRKWSIRLKEPSFEKVLASTDGDKLAIQYSAGDYEVYALGGKEFPIGDSGVPGEFYELDKPVRAGFAPDILGKGSRIEFKGSQVLFYPPKEAPQAPVWPPPGSEPRWTCDVGSELVETASVVKDRLLVVSTDAMLHVIDIKTGKEDETVPMSDLIDMRFWDEMPQNINNYNNAVMYTYKGNAYITGPSHFTRIGLQLFPSELSLDGETTPVESDSTENWALEKAISAWDTKSFKAAIAGMREVVSLWPDSSVGHLFLGMAFSTTGHIDDAISELEAALHIDPRNPDIIANLSGNYYLKIMSLDPKTQSDMIITYYKRIKEIRPTNAMAYVGLAELYLGRREFDKAADVIKESFNHGFMGPDMHALLLSAFYMSDDRAHALALSKEMIRFFPDSDIAYLIRGKLLCKLGRYKEAITLFKSIDLKPDLHPRGEKKLVSSFPRILTTGSVFFYGNALGLSGRYWDGIALLKDYMAAMPSDEELEILKSFHQRTLENPNLKPSPTETEIIEKFGEDSYLILQSESQFRIPATLATAQFLNLVDYITRSMQTLEPLEQLAADDPETLSYIGYLFAKNGRRLNDAKKYLESALESAPKDAVYHRNYAVYLTVKHHFKDAEKHFRKALKLNPGAEMLNYEYGLMLMKTGRFEEAAEHFRSELALVPDLEVAKKALAKAESYIKR